MSNPGKDDVELLLHDLLPFAERMLREHKEFFPFGGRMEPDGAIVWEGADDGREQPPSQELIEMLNEGHQQQAQSKNIKACATVYDIRTVPPGRTEKQDAIAVALDHESGYSVVVVFPYHFDSEGELRIEEPFAARGENAVFGGQGA